MFGLSIGTRTLVLLVELGGTCEGSDDGYRLESIIKVGRETNGVGCG